MLMLLMNETEAAALRAMEGENRLDPRLIEAGEHAGKYALPARVKADPAHTDKGLEAFPAHEIDPDTAWPPMED